jgi:predicted RNA polymerase sigma factor
MSDVSVRLRRLVRNRAGDRCEYCGLSQEGQEATFHVDHIVPRVAGGATDPENLALACVSCSLYKEARRSARDPQGGRLVPLFHPRRQRWEAHFRWKGVRVFGLTSTGRATVAALKMNRPVILAIRAEESERGRHPTIAS